VTSRARASERPFGFLYVKRHIIHSLAMSVTAARRPRIAVSVSAPAVEHTTACAFVTGAEHDAVPVHAVHTIHKTLRLPFDHEAAPAGDEPLVPPPEPVVVDAPAAGQPEQSISAWLQDARRVASKQPVVAADGGAPSRGTQRGPSDSAGPEPASLNQQRAAQRKAARPAHASPAARIDTAAFKKPRHAASTAQAQQSLSPAPVAFDFRAARKSLPHGGGFALAGPSASPVAAGVAKAPKPVLAPFAKSTAVEEPFKPGKRSTAFPRSGNRTWTFSG